MEVKKVTLVIEGVDGKREELMLRPSGDPINFLKFTLGRFDNNDPAEAVKGEFHDHLSSRR